MGCRCERVVAVALLLALVSIAAQPTTESSETAGGVASLTPSSDAVAGETSGGAEELDEDTAGDIREDDTGEEDVEDMEGFARNEDGPLGEDAEGDDAMASYKADGLKRGWREDDWLSRAGGREPLCPEGCACAEDTLLCAQPPPNATHLVLRGLPLGGALADDQAYEDTQGGGVFRAARRLLRLAVRDCELRALRPWPFAPLRVLRELDLSGNLLRTLPARAFAACDQLQKLFLSGNPLSSVPALQRDSLQWLQMDNCSLDEVPENAFEGTPQLVYLSMRWNALRTLATGALLPLKMLTHVHLEHNALTRLDPQLFSRQRHLQTLYLRGNPLQLPEEGPFLESWSLLILDLGECSIVNISEASFSRLPNLRSLQLTRNSIVSIPLGAFHPMKHLLSIDISYNKVLEIDPLAFKVLRYKGKAVLDVSGNPLGCSCLVLKCREAPRRCFIKSSGLRWRPLAGDAGDGGDGGEECSEAQRGDCLVGGTAWGEGDDSSFYANFDEDPLPDINLLLTPKESDVEASGDAPGRGLSLSVSDRTTQVAMGISGAVVFVIVIAVTVYMARRCRKEERERRESSDGEVEEAALSWTVMDPEAFSAPLRDSGTNGKPRPSGAARRSAGGVGDAWRRPRSHTGPPEAALEDDPLPPYEPPAGARSSGRGVARASSMCASHDASSHAPTHDFKRSYAPTVPDSSFPPLIQHHRSFDSD